MPVCSAPASVINLAEPIPTFKKAIEAHRRVRIVAFGSSSTEGIGATDRSKTYPARLFERLHNQFPDGEFEVYNRGRGGELASQMLARLDRDVISLSPTLVIWQTGVNDAMRDIDPDRFRNDVERGLARLKANGIDVILLDQQYSPRALNTARYRDYLKLMRNIGATQGVSVFRRFELMSHLIESAQYTVDELLASDRLH